MMALKPIDPSEEVAILHVRKESSELDKVEAEMLKMEPAKCEWTHSFVPGFYVRTIRMPKNAIVASRIHDTRHPFWITKGVVEVRMNGVNTVLTAPYSGMTEPGTRRLLFIHEDTEWTTFHHNPTEERDIELLEKMLLREHINSELGVDQSQIRQLHHEMNESLNLAAASAGGNV